MRTKALTLILVLVLLAGFNTMPAMAQGGEEADYVCNFVDVEADIVRQYTQLMINAGYEYDQISVRLPFVGQVILGQELEVFVDVHTNSGEVLIHQFTYHVDNCGDSPQGDLDWYCGTVLNSQDFDVILAVGFDFSMEVEFDEWVEYLGPIRWEHSEAELWAMFEIWKIRARGEVSYGEVSCNFVSGWHYVEMPQITTDDNQAWEWSMGNGDWFPVGDESSHVFGVGSGEGSHFEVRNPVWIGQQFEIRNTANHSEIYQMMVDHQITETEADVYVAVMTQ